MKEPCRSCEEKVSDAGGCRCQAYLLTGDPANADPVCAKSPMHERVINVVHQATLKRDPDLQPIMFRNDAKSRSMSRRTAKQNAPLRSDL
jgi:pyrroloquinoline quinone biosynthesis protein E